MQQYNDWRDDLFSLSRLQRRSAKRKIEETMDAISSSALFSAKRCRYDHGSFGAFPHACAESNDLLRKAPVVVEDQMLQCLHHRIGQTSTGKMFAYCPHCTMSWTNEEFIESYLIHGVEVPGLTHYSDNRVRRLKAMAVEFQKDSSTHIDSVVIDAAYNHHIHIKACFECKKKVAEFVPKNGITSTKRKRSGKGDECRFRQPCRKKHRTIVQNASLDPVKWYRWDGSYTERLIKEICIK